MPRQPKYLALAERIHDDIRGGKFVPGGKLPSERQLASRYRVAYLTARHAVTHLTRHGLVQREHRRGTFLKTNAHKGVVGVLCKVNFSDESAHFHRALMQAINAELDAHHLMGHAYDGRDGAGEGGDWPWSRTFQRFLNDIEHYSFAGLIALSWPKNWETPSRVAAIPRVRLTENRGQPDVSMDSEHFGFESISRLCHLGWRRIVYFRTAPPNPAVMFDLHGVERAVRRLAIAPPRIVQFPEIHNGFEMESHAYQQTILLIQEWRRTHQAPNALLVSDDIATRGVALALIKRGVRVPKELALMTLANEGILHHYGISALKYENSPRQLARRLVDVLHRRMENPSAVIPPITLKGRIVEGDV